VSKLFFTIPNYHRLHLILTVPFHLNLGDLESTNKSIISPNSP